MKCISLATAVALALFTAPACALPESAEMHLSGAVTAASTCSMNLENGGVIDLGQIDYASLNESSTTTLGSVQRTATVTCDSPTRFAVGIFDNRGETLNPARASCGHCLAMGWTSAQNPIGFYGVAINETPTIDGGTGRLAWSNDLQNWEEGISLYMTPAARTPGSNGRKYVAAAGVVDVPDPIPRTTVTFRITVEPTLESRDTMAITQPTTINGSSTLEIIYL